MPQVAATYLENKAAGLELMVFLGEDQYQQKPSVEYCKGYAKAHGLPLARTFIDYGLLGGWEILFENVNPYLAADGTFTLPWEAVLDSKNMEYKYCSSNTNGWKDLNAVLGHLLSQ
jgi:hypothetical protein